MSEPGGDPDFSEEAIGATVGAELWVEELQRDGPVLPLVLGQVHRGHATASDLGLDNVSAGKRLIQPCECVHTISGRRWCITYDA